MRFVFPHPHRLAPALCWLACLLTFSGCADGEERERFATGFESAEENAGWRMPASTEIDTSVARSGQKSLKVVAPKSGESKHFAAIRPFEVVPGQEYTARVWIRTEDVVRRNGGRTKLRGASLFLEMADERGKWKKTGGAYPKGFAGTNDWQLLEIPFTAPVPEDIGYLGIMLLVEGRGTAWFDDFSIERHFPPLVRSDIIFNRYRNETHGGPMAAAVRLSLEQNDLDVADVLVRGFLRDAQGRIVRELVPASIARDHFTFTFDSTGLAPGEYTVEANVRVDDGEREDTVRGSFVKLAEPRERTVRFDRHGRLIVDGAPMFPLGTYWGGGMPEWEKETIQGAPNEPTEKALAEWLDVYADSAFNVMMPYYYGWGREEFDRIHDHGLKALYSLKDAYAGKMSGLLKPSDEKPYIRKRVEALKDHPALLGWYLADEIDIELLDRLELHKEWVEELDPDHPALAVYWQAHIIERYLPGSHVLGLDPYPIETGNEDIGSVLRETRQAVNASFGLKPVWMVPQIFDWNREASRAPTLKELHNMAWQGITGGADGLIFYSWTRMRGMEFKREDGGIARNNRTTPLDPFEERWEDVRAMASEIGRFSDALLSMDPTVEMTPDVPDDVGWRLHAVGDVHYLFVANSTTESRAAVFRFGEAFDSATDRFRGKDEALEGERFDGRKLSINLQPLEVKAIVIK